MAGGDPQGFRFKQSCLCLFEFSDVNISAQHPHRRFVLVAEYFRHGLDVANLAVRPAHTKLRVERFFTG